MRLDKFVPPLGRGKYALIQLRELSQPRDVTTRAQITAALALLANEGILDYGGGIDDFFVMRLRDTWAAAGLDAYAAACAQDDPEFSKDIRLLADRAYDHPARKTPD